MNLFLKYKIKALGYPTKYDHLPTDFINPNTVELPEVEVAEADQPRISQSEEG